MKTLDPIDHIRSNPAMYLPVSGDVSQYLAQRLISDAMLLGANEVDIHRDGDWYQVAADKDWFSSAGAAEVRELFCSIVPFPQAGVNSMRSEVLLTAFARDVVTSDQNAAQLIKGPFPADFLTGFVASWPWARVIRFRV